MTSKKNRSRSALARCGMIFAGVVLLCPALIASAAPMTPAEPEKTGNMALVYGIVAVFSVLLVVGYLLWEKKKERKFLLLYSCVAITNCGYFLQAVSDTLNGALMANRVSYFGAAYAVLIMLLIIQDACRVKPPRWVRIMFIGISTAAFLIAASGGILNLYYTQVSIESINGVTRLVKEYGPLHIVYPIYLLSCFAAMVTTIVYAAKQRKLTSLRYAVFLVSVVLGNIAVWLVGQIIYVEFEFLSVSYIATEILLLLLYGLLREYGLMEAGFRLGAVHQQAPAGELPPNMEELFDSFIQKAKTLSAAEQRILGYYIDGHEIADIPELAFVSINTVKKHNRSIYQKLEVASRDELMLYIELFRRCGRLPELKEQA